MFDTPYNKLIQQQVLGVNAKFANRLHNIQEGDAYDNFAMKHGGAYSAGSYTSGRRPVLRNEEYRTSGLMTLPTNTRSAIPTGAVSTRNSNLYLPIKTSGAFQTPENVSQFYHNGGIQGSGAKKYNKREHLEEDSGSECESDEEGGAYSAGAMSAGAMSGLSEKDAKEKVVNLLVQHSGQGKPNMKKIVKSMVKHLKARKHKQLKGKGFFSKLWSGVKDVGSKIVSGVKDIAGIAKQGKETYDQAKSIYNTFVPATGKGKMSLSDAESIGKVYADNYSSLMNMAGSGIAIPAPLGYKGGVSGSYEFPVPIGANASYGGKSRRSKKKEPEMEGDGFFSNLVNENKAVVKRNFGGKKRKIGGATSGGAMSKAKHRGMLISKLMKEKKMTLGEASKHLKSMSHKEGAGFFGDLWHGIKSVAETAAPFVPLLL